MRGRPINREQEGSAIWIALLVIRSLFFLCAVGTGSYLAKLAGSPESQLTFMGISATIAVVLILTEIYFARSPIAIVSAVTVGTIMGFLMGWLFTGLIEVVAQPSLEDLQATRLILTLIGVYLGITLILQTKDDFKFIVPYVEFSRELRGTRPLLLDTSALIDGRFAELCRMRLYEAPVIVPRFVIDELQTLADSQDKAKRARGRRGLDVLKAVRTSDAQVEIFERDVPEIDAMPGVDRKLVVLARNLGAVIVTTDAALQQIGGLEGVRVLNVHEIARAVQVRATAGERFSLKIVKPGEGAEQGVGYLEDGSMVVVERGRARVGEEVLVEVTGNIKTSAGQMFFAKISS